MYIPNRVEESIEHVEGRKRDIVRLGEEIADLTSAQTTGLKRLREQKRLQLAKIIKLDNIVKKDITEEYVNRKMTVDRIIASRDALLKASSLRSKLDAKILTKKAEPLIKIQKGMLEYFGIKFFE